MEGRNFALERSGPSKITQRVIGKVDMSSFLLAPRLGVYCLLSQGLWEEWFKCISRVKRYVSGWRDKKSEVWGSIFVISRSETLTLKKPKAIPKEQGRVFQMPDMRRILQMFDGKEC